jgi:hypothetical protein
MRSDLRYVGWLTGSLSGHPSLSGKDYCPECRVWHHLTTLRKIEGK